MIFEAGLEIVHPASSPDTINHGAGRPGVDFIVSRTAEGEVASRLSDLVWDYSAYSPSGRLQLLRFDTWCNHPPTRNQMTRIREMQDIMVTLIWIAGNGILSFATIARYLYALNKLAMFAEAKRMTIEGILQSRALLTRFLDEHGDYYTSVIGRILQGLSKTESELSGMSVLSRKEQKFIEKRRKAYVASMQQTAPIPTSIYTSVLAGLQRSLTEFEKVRPQLLRVVEQCGKDPLIGRTLTAQRERAGGAKQFAQIEPKPTLEQLVGNSRLRRYLSALGRRMDVKVLSVAISDIQIRIALSIAAYSGMRLDEIRNLPLHCLEKKVTSGVTHYRIKGFTTKSNGGRRLDAAWITSKEGARAIRAAQSIARSLYKCININPTKSHAKYQHLPMFVSPTYLGFCGRRSMRWNADVIATARFQGTTYEQVLTGLIPDIAEEDVLELELVDPHRNWRDDDKYAVGRQWPLATLQFRRSFGLYASNSGYVSLPTLRRQLQHITEETSRYYARGSESAAKLISSKDHPGRVHQQAQAESEALAFIKNCLMSDEDLFGGFGHRVNRSVNEDGALGVSLDTHSETLRRANRGELAYKETALGGCAEPAPCRKKALRSVIGCLNCANAVIKQSKLERVISAQESLLDELVEGSVEWRIEKDDLEKLLSTQSRLGKEYAHLD